MKEDKEEDLRSTMNDYSKSSHERTAAAMTLMERGELSQEEAKVKSGEISSSYKNDNRVLNQLDGALKGNYQDLTRVFSDLKTSKEGSKEREVAEKKIVNGVITGDIKMHSIDDQSSLDLIIPKLAEKMTPVNFKSMYNSQTTEKRSQIKQSLEVSGTDKSKDQLVNIQNNLNPLETNEKKINYLSNADKEQIQKIADSADGFRSLIDVFKGDAELQRLARAGDNDKFEKALNLITKKAQLDRGNTRERALLNRIMKAVIS
jgi:hypothetical protein